METSNRFTFKRVRPELDISDAEVVKDPAVEETGGANSEIDAAPEMPEPQYVLDFPIEDKPGEVTDQRLLDFLNGLKPTSTPSVETAKPKTVVTLANYKAILHKNGINQTMLKFLLEIAEKNPDPMVFADKKAQPGSDAGQFSEAEYDVSPVLMMRIRDKKLKRLMKSIHLYNVLSTKQDKEEWAYLFKEAKVENIFAVSIKRQDYGSYVSKLEGFGMAMAQFLEGRKTESRLKLV